MLYRVVAALMFFTRLPLWRLFHVDAGYFKRVVPLWPITGWLTGGMMGGVFWLSSMVFPVSLSALFAVASRLLLTGALHEDGFADFCDGFGGGTSRDRTLRIMKDSHIGTYGVIGLIIYYLTLLTAVTSLPASIIPSALLCGDVFCKFIASNIINVLPYARKEEEAKNKLTYSKMSVLDFLLATVSGMAALLWLPDPLLILAGIAPILTSLFLFCWMKKRLNGYTGDCCGATFIIGELAFQMGLLLLVRISCR